MRCVAQAEDSEIIRRMPDLDMVIGPQTYHKLHRLVSNDKKKKIIETDFPIENKFNLSLQEEKGSKRSLLPF